MVYLNKQVRLNAHKKALKSARQKFFVSEVEGLPSKEVVKSARLIQNVSLKDISFIKLSA